MATKKDVTLAQLRKARPMQAAAPKDHAAFVEWSEEVKRSRGRPLQGEHPKVRTSIYLSRSVLEKFKATGPGWQTRINEVLERAEL
jgi:uncharacterized protein (DUF4415 family)